MANTALKNMSVDRRPYEGCPIDDHKNSRQRVDDQQPPCHTIRYKSQISFYCEDRSKHYEGN
jgi:hypothetical protein